LRIPQRPMDRLIDVLRFPDSESRPMKTRTSQMRSPLA
jgi:hypothetical protein